MSTSNLYQITLAIPIIHSYSIHTMENSGPFDDHNSVEAAINYSEDSIEDEVLQAEKMGKEWQENTNATTLEMEKNIEFVRRLQIKGVKKAREQQEALKKAGIDLTMRTVYKYRGIIKKRLAKKVIEKHGLNKTVEQLAIEFQEDYGEVIRELWKIFHEPGTSNRDKIRALADIRKASVEIIDKLQSLGLAYKEPEKQMMIGPDGKPVDPEANVKELNQQFTAFIKAKYQDPVGTVQDNGH